MTENPQFILPDVLQPGLMLVFCGTAASTISARDAAYYANPSNYFWRTLYQIGLTDRQLSPQAYHTLTDYNIGLTDMAKYVSGQDNILKATDFDRDSFIEKIITCEPHTVAFTSKKAASAYLQRPTRKIAYGKQSEMIQQTHLWVLPSPSGAARAYWDISIWQSLADNMQHSE